MTFDSQCTLISGTAPDDRNQDSWYDKTMKFSRLLILACTLGCVVCFVPGCGDSDSDSESDKEKVKRVDVEWVDKNHEIDISSTQLGLISDEIDLG